MFRNEMLSMNMFNVVLHPSMEGNMDGAWESLVADFVMTDMFLDPKSCLSKTRELTPEAELEHEVQEAVEQVATLIMGVLKNPMCGLGE